MLAAAWPQSAKDLLRLLTLVACLAGLGQYKGRGPSAKVMRWFQLGVFVSYVGTSAASCRLECRREGFTPSAKEMHWFQ